MKKILLIGLFTLLLANLSISSSYAKNNDPPKDGKISGKSVAAGALSLLVWPGIGQAVNNDSGQKCIVHAVLGIIFPYRIWSGYDALMDRKGGYWQGRI